MLSARDAAGIKSCLDIKARLEDEIFYDKALQN